MKDILIFRATLKEGMGNTYNDPSRIIAIHNSGTLYKLAEAIIDSFDFDFDHAFGFYNNLKNYFKSEEGYELFADIGEESEFSGVEKTKIRDVFDQKNKKLMLVYDYGDEWHFIVEVTGEENDDGSNNYPRVVESYLDAPQQYPGDEDIP